MTEPNDIILKYAAGIQLSTTMDTATIVLLEQADTTIVRCETVPCSGRLNELSDWFDEHVGAAGVAIAAGVDSSQVRFLDIRIPAVAETQQHRLLKTQAEAVLPLTADQMALAWHAEEDGQNLLCKTAVLRRERVQPLLTQPVPIRHITPEAAGLAAVWACRKDLPQRCIIVRRRDHDVLFAWVNNGHLQRSAVIDADTDNLNNETPSGVLLQDIQTELETMDADGAGQAPVFLLAGKTPDAFLEVLCRQIQGIGWDCTLTRLEDVCDRPCGFEAVEAYGLALTASADRADYDFRRAEAMDRPDESRLHAAARLRKAIVVTILLLAAALGASWWSAKHEVNLLREVIATEIETLTVQQVLDAQSYRETVARARPDMTDVFERIQKCRGDTLLDTFEFEKGKPVKITATAKSYDAAYEFQKKLETDNKNVITAVRLLEPRLDQKTNQVRFTMTFQYRNFSH